MTSIIVPLMTHDGSRREQIRVALDYKLLPPPGTRVAIHGDLHATVEYTRVVPRTLEAQIDVVCRPLCFGTEAEIEICVANASKQLHYHLVTD